MINIIVYSVSILITISFYNFSFSQELQTDSLATYETKNLYNNLRKISHKGTMFGHQDDMLSGASWKNDTTRSDTKEAVGQYPAVFGWDLGWLEIDESYNFGYLPFDKIRECISLVYKRGGINTLSWHCNNPVNPKLSVRANQPGINTIEKIFDDPENLLRYKRWLDKISDFLLSLKTEDGKLIPIIFRPFHENNGSWFWWGKDHCLPSEYIKLWRFTIDYLKNKKNVHNLIYAYSTDKFKNELEFLERYPGNDYVDILGFDLYKDEKDTNGTYFMKDAISMTNMLRKIAIERKKVYAISETGFIHNTKINLWTNNLAPVIKDSGLSYILCWRNSVGNYNWSIYPGDSSVYDFKIIYNNSNLLFLDSISKKKVYLP
ncbi:mannan endo-1,4-beta-mannosidase [Dyadobacter frigoris]|uniref:glycoside hydrolase family 26 protein n=1 Tax=Dyadobacter frigoris TaxID=2576211 RepID=UPI0024A427B0|nr:glycosyl hydrolase [Dyadobacter frigoris]GLU52709.1 mannan endo-1,4-beta-mannosidase [Dyadobacter frigoris]